MLGQALSSLRADAERRANALETWTGPSPTLRGYALYYKDRREARHWGALSYGEAEGARAIVVTDEKGESKVALRFTHVRELSLQEYADNCRREVYKKLEQELRALRNYIEHQQKRFDNWSAKPLLPRKGSPEDKALPSKAKTPTKKELAAERFREKFRARYGREPIWSAWQTTNNNAVLLDFSHLISIAGKNENGQCLYSEEKTQNAFMKAASKVMNLYGMNAFLEWLRGMMGDLKLDERGRELLTADGEQVRFMSDVMALEAALDLLRRGPTPVPDYEEARR